MRVKEEKTAFLVRLPVELVQRINTHVLEHTSSSRNAWVERVLHAALPEVPSEGEHTPPSATGPGDGGDDAVGGGGGGHRISDEETRGQPLPPGPEHDPGPLADRSAGVIPGAGGGPPGETFQVGDGGYVLIEGQKMAAHPHDYTQVASRTIRNKTVNTYRCTTCQKVIEV